jgi:hypothetical protein
VVASAATNRPPQLIDDPPDLFMEASQPGGAEKDIPEAVVDRFEADLEFGQQVTGVDPAVLPANAAVAADQAPLEMPRVDDGLERGAIRAR